MTCRIRVVTSAILTNAPDISIVGVYDPAVARELIQGIQYMAGFMARGALLIGLSLFASLAQAARQPDYLSGAFIQNAGQHRPDITYVTSLPTHQLHVLRDGRVLHSLPLARNGARVSTAWVVMESLDG